MIHNIFKYVRYVFMTLLALSVLAVLAFGPRGGAVIPPHRVVIEYWEKWTGNEARQMRKIVHSFNHTVGRRRGIYVRYLSTSNIDQKTLIATAAGVPPDIAGLWDMDLAAFASLGALTPLGRYAREYGITAHTYQPVYWRACHYHGRLYALVSTPMAVALLYNKQIFRRNAAKLRAAGLNPNQPPKTLAQLNRYARVLTKFGSHGRLLRAGYLPITSWYVNETYLWFGGRIWNRRTRRFTLTSPPVIQAYRWIQSYSQWLGVRAMMGFYSGLSNFDSPQNPFLTGQLVMEQQGPWMANYIYHLKPGMSTRRWPKKLELKMPLRKRVKNYAWAFAPFPSAVPGLKNVTYAGFDCFVIPRGAPHPRKAFAFIAYVNRQKVMERLCMMQGKNSPLARVSRNFLEHSKNPYVNVFEKLAGGPNAHGLPRIPIMPRVYAELNIVAQRVALREAAPRQALARAQKRLQAQYDRYETIQRLRRAEEGQRPGAGKPARPGTAPR